MNSLSPFRHVLLDIEGTTTSISFVYDVLFPFARKAIPGHLQKVWGSERAQELEALFAADQDVLSVCPQESRHDGTPEGLARHALWQMESDKKTTALKALQGDVWKSGYASGELKADVFEDVPGALKAWNEEGIPVSIYSSGSVPAQKLLFGHTHYGDLTPWLRSYYDTRTGPKRVAESYRAIAGALGCPPGEILFATDVVQEAHAATEAGLQAVLMDRPGNRPQGEHSFTMLKTFCTLLRGNCSKTL